MKTVKTNSPVLRFLKSTLDILLLLIVLSLTAAGEKNRVFVLTDIENEPDG